MAAASSAARLTHHSEASPSGAAAPAVPAARGLHLRQARHLGRPRRHQSRDVAGIAMPSTSDAACTSCALPRARGRQACSAIGHSQHPHRLRAGAEEVVSVDGAPSSICCVPSSRKLSELMDGARAKVRRRSRPLREKPLRTMIRSSNPIELARQELVAATSERRLDLRPTRWRSCG